jgi:hypothetical protein
MVRAHSGSAPLVEGYGPRPKRCSGEREHVRQKFLGQAERGAANHVLGLQHPSAKPATNGMERVASGILLRLRQQHRLIAIDQVPQLRMRVIGVYKSRLR